VVAQSSQTQGLDSLHQRLAKLERAQLEALVRGLAADQPDWLPAIDRQLGKLDTEPPAKPRARRRGPDTAALRRELRSVWRLLDPYEAYAYVDVTREFAERAYSFLEKDDVRGALAVLETVTQEYIDCWVDLDDSDGEAAAYFEELGALWAEALLTADLTQAERRTYAQHLRRWQSDTDDYGVDAPFALALEALGTAPSGMRGASPDLVAVQLTVLERQGRFEEALQLADRPDTRNRYLSLHVQLGRLSEAHECALRQVTQAHDMLEIASALDERGARQQALELGVHGLSLAGEVRPLARWLRDTATDAGERDVAIRAGLRVLADQPALDDYHMLVDAAGNDWPTLREPVLEQLRERALTAPTAVGEILVYEGLLDEAIALADRVPTAYSFVEHVADAAIASHPDWVAQMARRQAERIVDRGDAQYYHYAIAWLKRARAASLALSQEPEWRAYVSGLLARHARKRALVPGLKALQR
jgi:uncharacterized Zn finger protein